MKKQDPGQYADLRKFANQAACAQPEVDHRAFHSEEDPAAVRYAQTICEQCPAQNPCFLYALKYEAYGIWGGMTPKQRRSYQRRARRLRRSA